MKDSKRRVLLRATALAIAATAVLTALVVALAPSLHVDPAQPFAVLLSQLCSAALLGCAAWAWAVTLLVLLEAVVALSGPDRDLRLRARRRGIPSAYRRLVLGACGLALSAGVAAPALATPGPVHLDPPVATPRSAVAITPAAPRAPVHAPRRASAGSDIVVRPGDSLWHLAAERLSPEASDATVEHTWRRLYAANAELIGADPDHIEPGQRLERPRGW